MNWRSAMPCLIAGVLRSRSARTIGFLAIYLQSALAIFPATPVTVRWATSGGGVADDTAFAVTLDNIGNAYVAGYFDGFAAFGSGMVMSRGSQGIFISKVSNAGQFLWTRQAGGTNLDEARAIAVGANSNLFVTGSFQNGAAFGGTNLNSAGQADVFLAKLDTAGAFLWVIQAGGAESDEGRGIALDSQGNIFVTGNFGGNAGFGDIRVTSKGMTDIFVAKYSGSGDLLWLRTAGGLDVEEARALSVDSSGAACVTGRFRGTAQFESTNLVSAGSDDIFLAKYSDTGELLWVRSAGGMEIDEGSGVGHDKEENVYLTGLFNGTSGFGNTNLNSHGGADVFLAKHSRDGVLQWVVQAGGGSADEGHALSVDADGNSYVTGIFLENASFGGTLLTAGFGNAEVFLAKFDRRGKGIWATASGGTAYINGHAIAADPLGNVYAAGYFRSPSTFGGLRLPNASSGRDVFVVRVDGPPRLNVRRQGTQSLLSWPDSATGYRLDGTLDLTEKWSAVTNSSVAVGDQRIVTNVSTNARQFFRLIKP